MNVAIARASCKPEENIYILLQKTERKCANWVKMFMYPSPVAALHTVRLFTRSWKVRNFYMLND